MSQILSQPQDDISQPTNAGPAAALHPFQEQAQMDEGPDPSTLPPATAPPSHPSINPSVPAMLDGRSIFDVDMSNMAEKPWRRPGSDLSDWFNYGFDEISWEAYCYRRREMGEMATVLKTNVINFAGMPEDQLMALPPEVRTMVMTGATAMMAGGGPNPGMMAPGVGMNPMMHDMSGMGPMGMGPMGMGMNGDMGMQMPPGGPMMQDGPGPVPGPGGSAIGPGPSVTPEQGMQGQMNMQDGFGPGGPGPGMMGMNMGGEFGMQVCLIHATLMPQVIYCPSPCEAGPKHDGSSTDVPGNGGQRDAWACDPWRDATVQGTRDGFGNARQRRQRSRARCYVRRRWQ